MCLNREELPSSQCVNYDVPQGSILGPILFTSNYHLLPETCLSYADDTSSIVSAVHPIQLQYKMIEFHLTAREWVDKYGRSMN